MAIPSPPSPLPPSSWWATSSIDFASAAAGAAIAGVAGASIATPIAPPQRCSTCIAIPPCLPGRELPDHGRDGVRSTTSARHGRCRGGGHWLHRDEAALEDGGP